MGLFLIGIYWSQSVDDKKKISFMKKRSFLWSLNFDIWLKPYDAHTPAAPDTFLACPIPSHFQPISLHSLLILKSIAAPPELSVWNGVAENLLLGGKNLKLYPGAKSSHFKLHNDGNNLMRSVRQCYLQWLRKDIKCETKKQSQSSSFRGRPERSPKLPPSACSVAIMKLSVGVGLL